jgi:hypothetical protein
MQRQTSGVHSLVLFPVLMGISGVGQGKDRVGQAGIPGSCPSEVNLALTIRHSICADFLGIIVQGTEKGG